MSDVKAMVKRALLIDYRGKCVREVLDAFKKMGADRSELRKEKAKLMRDDMYLAEWSVAVDPKRDVGNA